MSSTITIRGLTVVRGGREVIRAIDVEIEAGVVTGLLGPSGSGKTTLMRSIVGAQIVASGSVEVLGLAAGSPELRSRVGYQTQSPSVYPDITVAENLDYFAAIVGVGRERIAETLAVVGLKGHERQVAGTLSGGELARLSLAAALLNEPDVLILDEPTVGLDPLLRRDLWATFHGLADAGATVVVSSHVMDEAERCDRLLLLREGGMLAAGTPDALRARTGTSDLGAAFLALVDDDGAAPVSLRCTLATAHRVLRQLRHDPRTIGLLLAVPCVLQILVHELFSDRPLVFQSLGVPLLGLFPFVAMFIVTSITMLRERVSGTLERLLTTPIARGDLLAGYGLAFALVAAAQATLVSVISFGLLGLESDHRLGVVALAIANAVLGMSLGLFASAFARTEFQAVQFMPAFILPQILLCGLLVPREEMAGWLQALSAVLPLTYAYDALARIADDVIDARFWFDVAVVLGVTVLALVLGAGTLRRRTP